MTKRQKRKWESAKRQRQEDRRSPIYYTGVDSMDVLRRILPEGRVADPLRPATQSDALSQLRREPERLTFWQRTKMFFTG